MAEDELERIEFHGDSRLDFDNITFIVLSSVLACVALLSNSIPVLIGAMILAPAFDPLIAIPFGILNRDWKLAFQGLLNSLVLFVISFAACMSTVWLLLYSDVVPLDLIDLGTDLVIERLTVGWHSVVIAIAAGAGGAVASASDRKPNLVGVVVALALVPALAAAAIAFNYGDASGWGGIELFALNVGGVIVAGFLILSLRRGSGKAERKAKEATD